MTEIEELASFAQGLANAAGKAILPHFRQDGSVDNKLGEGWDPVTEGDRAAERAIRDLIEKKYPTHGVVGEEFGTKKGTSAYTWILDPIDGTRAFVIGLPVWTTLIGLYREGDPHIGLMNQPYVGEAFLGTPDGSFHLRNGERNRIRAGRRKPLAEALAGTTSPHLYPDANRVDKLQRNLRMLRFGGDAYFFSLVAAGHLDVALDPGLQIYDIAALIPIIRGAGGVVGTWDKGDPAQGGNVIAASCAELLDQVTKIMAG